jgi:DNA-binding sugar fermentation-stimulating protein
MEPIYSLVKPLVKAKVLSRPSKKIKSPYLADILIDDKEYICHSAPLGCSGHIIEGSIVWVLEKEKSKAHSSHEIYLIEENGTLIGCHPLVANKIAHQLLKRQLILPNIKSIVSENTINDCRFDFIAKCDEKMSIIEVKSVPIADYFDGTSKEVQEYLKEFSQESQLEKIAIFPYCTTSGKRKLSKEPLSERALKHVESLTNLSTTYKCVLLFIVQRNDVSKFCITKLDPIYKDACKKALESGVIIKAISVKWDTQHCYYEKDLEIVW